MYWEVLYHSTNMNFFEHILKAHEINYDSKHIKESKDIAFLSFMSSDVVFPGKRLVWNYRGNPIIFGIDTKILRKQDFVVCDDMYMGMCTRYPKHTIIDTRGKNTNFNTKVITDHINKRASPDNIYNISYFKLMMYKYETLFNLTDIINDAEYKQEPLSKDIVDDYLFWSSATEDQLRERYLEDTLTSDSMYFGRTHEIIIEGGVPEKYWKFILIPKKLKHIIEMLKIPAHVELRYYSYDDYWDVKTMLKP